MRLLIILSFVLCSSFSFSQSQQVRKLDSVTIKFSWTDINIIYASVDNAHGDHIVLKNLLDYINQKCQQAAAEQAKRDTLVAPKKKP